jgi:saccharopine dehydrogenase-like NADP-dependent oxidoreductase
MESIRMSEESMKKVIIVGAGAQGNVIAGILAKAPEVGKIMLVDLDLGRAQEVARYLNSDKIEVGGADASNKDELVELFKQDAYDLVVNATLMAFNRQIIEASLEAGSHYIDMASDEFLPEKDGKQYPVEQFEYAEEFEKQGLMANILAGGDAGLVNVMAREAVDELDEVDYNRWPCGPSRPTWRIATTRRSIGKMESTNGPNHFPERRNTTFPTRSTSRRRCSTTAMKSP